VVAASAERRRSALCHLVITRPLAQCRSARYVMPSSKTARAIQTPGWKYNPGKSIKQSIKNKINATFATKHVRKHQNCTLDVTSNLSKAHETRDSLAVPVRRLSCSISIHFVAIHAWNLLAPQSQITKKNTKTTYFGGSRSFKIIDVDITKKLVTIACYDKQHVCAYLQPFSRYTSQ